MLRPGQQEEKRLKTLSDLTLLLSQCKMREELYERRYEGAINEVDPKDSYLEHHVTYKNSLRDIYIEILRFVATCCVYLSQNSLVRAARSSVAWDGWIDLNDGIIAKEKVLLNVEQLFDAFKVQEEWERRQDWSRRMLAKNQAIFEEVERIASMMQDEKRTKLLEWLTSVNIDAKYNNERERHREGTGLWLVKGHEFGRWKQTPNSVIWLHGKVCYMPLF
jgi:hypothetical protein